LKKSETLVRRKRINCYFVSGPESSPPTIANPPKHQIHLVAPEAPRVILFTIRVNSYLKKGCPPLFEGGIHWGGGLEISASALCQPFQWGNLEELREKNPNASDPKQKTRWSSSFARFRRVEKKGGGKGPNKKKPEIRTVQPRGISNRRQQETNQPKGAP